MNRLGKLEAIGREIRDRVARDPLLVPPFTEGEQVEARTQQVGADAMHQRADDLDGVERERARDRACWLDGQAGHVVPVEWRR